MIGPIKFCFWVYRQTSCLSLSHYCEINFSHVHTMMVRFAQHSTWFKKWHKVELKHFWSLNFASQIFWIFFVTLTCLVQRTTTEGANMFLAFFMCTCAAKFFNFYANNIWPDLSVDFLKCPIPHWHYKWVLPRKIHILVDIVQYVLSFVLILKEHFFRNYANIELNNRKLSEICIATCWEQSEVEKSFKHS